MIVDSSQMTKKTMKKTNIDEISQTKTMKHKKTMMLIVPPKNNKHKHNKTNKQKMLMLIYNMNIEQKTKTV
jgi:hypothetical protein